MQAPQRDIPQPYFVPVSPTSSRKTQSKGVSGSMSTEWDTPFIDRFIAMERFLNLNFLPGFFDPLDEAIDCRGI
jgi:hypothetical protein